jgi:sugar transferase (PEP-CTERM/EpsH1 system associated)
VPLSQELGDYLRDQVGVANTKIHPICNGVDVERFRPREGTRDRLLPPGFADQDSFLIGAVGRLEAVKDQLTLVRAFIEMCRSLPSDDRLRLVLVGDGSLRSEIEALLGRAGIRNRVWLAGSRDDVPELLASLDSFALPSLAEGISNTLLEAMASGLPVVATRVGGNSELVVDGVSGLLVPRADPGAMAEALLCYLDDEAMRSRHGTAARQRAVENYSIDGMVSHYQDLYDECQHAPH